MYNKTHPFYFMDPNKYVNAIIKTVKDIMIKRASSKKN